MTTQNEKTDAQKNGPKEPDLEPMYVDDWGYDLYPERRGTIKKDVFKTIIGVQGREEIHKSHCERNVYWCLSQSPLVKLMLGALKGSGCEFDIRRHVVCEVCDKSVTGGYDPILNQIVVCQNTAKSKGIVQGVLTHEMIHMFDYCCNNLDFKNIEHLACTEIRAANLAHCSFASAWFHGTASIFNIKATHQECVRAKAIQSIMAARKITLKQATEVVERVFTKCYNDLEPIGRRIKRNSLDMEKAYIEGHSMGYY